MKHFLAFVLLSLAGIAGGGEVRVEPGIPVVPANHLKFYLHFPGPMERGDVFRHLRLVELDAEGHEVREVPEPFREVELWDETFTRFTLWFHPGRQKPGVNLNVEIGPILEEGKRYRLELSGKWKSESGVEIGGMQKHEFVAGVIDETQPDPREWKIVVEGPFVWAGVFADRNPESRPPKHAIRIQTGETLDPESVRKRISVIHGEKGETLPLRIEPFEHGFRLVREEGWTPGDYRLVIDPRLEDLAGNSIARPFNLDLDGAVAERKVAVEIPFKVSAAP